MSRGTLITESLRLGAALQVAGLRVTTIARRDVADSATAEQPTVWTMVEFEHDDDVADELADQLAGALRSDGGWYADFSVGADHVVVFAGRIFRYRGGDLEARREAEVYGRAVGVPDHQLDWPD